MKRVAGKVAIVTGGAAGIGSGIVRKLAAEGAKVVVTDIQAGAGQALANEVGGTFIKQDVTDEKQWAALIDAVREQHGALHILVNNAGIEGPFEAADPERTLLADWQAIQRVNVEGVFLGCRAAIALLTQSGGGSIINLSSTAALAPTPEFAAYGASKAAVRHLTTSVAIHCARSGSRIRCNSVHPGVIVTPMLQRIAEELARKRGTSAAQILEDFRKGVPQGEFQDVEDIAFAVLFLASDEARHITGLAMVVDGGTTV